MTLLANICQISNNAYFSSISTPFSSTSNTAGSIIGSRHSFNRFEGGRGSFSRSILDWAQKSERFDEGWSKSYGVFTRKGGRVDRYGYSSVCVIVNFIGYRRWVWILGYGFLEEVTGICGWSLQTRCSKPT